MRAGLKTRTLVLVVSFSLTTCGGEGREQQAKVGDDDRQAIERTYERAEEAFNSADAQRLAAFYTDRALESVFGVSREAFAGGANPLGRGRLMFDIVEIERLAGNRATVLVDIELGQLRAVERVRERLIKQDGQWKFDQVDPVPLPVPEGLELTNLELADYAYRFNQEEMSRGAQGLRLRNTGKENHEVDILLVPDGVTLQQAVTTQSSTPNRLPEGWVDQAYGFVPAGAESTVVLRGGPIPKGRYVMLCYLPVSGQEEVLHMSRGMAAEFTVE